MATELHNLSLYDINSVPSAKEMHFVVIVSEWNTDITFSLLKGCVETLIKHEAQEENIKVVTVPGSFELTTAAGWFANKGCSSGNDYDAVICLGCVIQGETRHFDFICDAVAKGLTNIGIDTGVPTIFGVLTTQNMQQAMDRSGGKHGNKGDEAAITAIKMAGLAYKEGLFEMNDYI